jgi:hypothetical protein
VQVFNVTKKSILGWHSEEFGVLAGAQGLINPHHSANSGVSGTSEGASHSSEPYGKPHAIVAG